jgi:predicted Zn-dependent protease
MKFTPKPIEENINVSQTSALKELFVLLGGLVGIIIVVYLALGAVVDFVVPRLPTGIERGLGRLYARSFESWEPTPAEAYLQELVDALTAELDDPEAQYKVHVIPSSQPNAMALAGGHIIVLSGLLEEMDSENELAFILAHELGHFAHRDHLRGLGRGLVMMAISTALVGVDNQITNLLMRSVMTVEMKFSQRQETQADLFALHVLNLHYGHIAGATDFFEKISQTDTRGRLTYYFATHPYPPDRIAKLQQKIEELGYQTGEKRPLDARLNTLPPAEDTDDLRLQDIFGQQ